MNCAQLLRYLLMPVFFVTPLLSKDVILEFKAAYFLPTNSVFRHIYQGGALFGPELTMQLCDNKNWYGFASIDYLQKSGRSLGLCDATKVKLLPLGIGLKYFVPMVCDRADFYLGLGFQPVYMRTKNCSSFVAQKQSRWGFGGIAKVGTYVYLPQNFVLDFFVDYSFVKIGCKTPCQTSGTVIPTKANLSGAIFGGGIGYRF